MGGLKGINPKGMARHAGVRDCRAATSGPLEWPGAAQPYGVIFKPESGEELREAGESLPHLEG